jgi:hypothetical protein
MPPAAGPLLADPLELEGARSVGAVKWQRLRGDQTLRRQKEENKTEVRRTPNRDPPKPRPPNAEPQTPNRKAPTKCGQWTSRVGGDGEKQAGVNP